MMSPDLSATRSYTAIFERSFLGIQGRAEFDHRRLPFLLYFLGCVFALLVESKGGVITAIALSLASTTNSLTPQSFIELIDLVLVRLD